MKKLFRLLPAIVVATMFAGCGRSANGPGEKTFDRSESLASTLRPMDLVIKLSDISLCGDYVVVQDAFSGSDYNYAVFDHNLDYKYSFCRRGVGPQECQFPVIVADNGSNTCLIRDHGNNSFTEYELTDTGAVFLSTWALPIARFDSPFQLSKTDSDHILLKNIGMHSVRRQLWSIADSAIVDTLPQRFDYETRLARRYHPEYDDFKMVADKSRFMCAYVFQDFIEFGTSDGNRLAITAAYGSPESPDLYWYEDEPKSDEFKYNVDYNIVYYEAIASGLNRFWATYAGVPWGNIDTHSKVLESYSLAGEPLVRYELDKPVADFIVLDNPKRIVALNPDLYEDSFIVFSL